MGILIGPAIVIVLLGLVAVLFASAIASKKKQEKIGPIVAAVSAAFTFGGGLLATYLVSLMDESVSSVSVWCVGSFLSLLVSVSSYRQSR